MKKIEEQFDEKFPSGVFNFYYKIQYIKKVKEIKQFYSSKISKLLGDLVGEEIVQDYFFDGYYSEGLMIGKNKKRQEIIDIIKASEFNEFLTSGKR